MKDKQDIDFVITWVDGNDSNWKKEKSQYLTDNNGDSTEIRYRDWCILKYWFRSVEANAPWVRKIHFVTYGHLPEFLNVNHPKLNIVTHNSFIPEEYLPTFSSHPIELNMHRIEELAECFVYFNDDMFINKPMEQKDFFVNGKPCYEALEGILQPGGSMEGVYWHILLNNMTVINNRFNKRQVYKNNLFKWLNWKYGIDVMRNICLFPWSSFGNIVNRHLAMPMLKSTMYEVWDKEYEVLNRTSLHKIRAITDVNPWLFRYWDIMKGNFVVKHNKGRAYHIKDVNIDLARRDIECGLHDLICINDTSCIQNFECVKTAIQNAFQKRYPEKCSFER